MDLIVLDNGLVDRGAHSYHIAIALSSELRRLGIRYRIFSAKKVAAGVAAETGAVPFFRRNLYESVRRRTLRQLLKVGLRTWATARRDLPFDPNRSEALTFKTLNRDYRRDLRRLRDAWKPENVVLVVAISQNELLGLVTHLRSLPVEQRPAVVCQLMFSPSWTSWGAESVRGAVYYRRIFDLAAPLLNRSLFFVTETTSAAAYYKDAFKVSADVLPIPLAVSKAHRESRPSGGKVRFGYFGYSKTGKGFHLLPRAISLCNERGLEVEFFVQSHHTAWEPAVIHAERALESLKAVRLIKGALSKDEYYALVNQVDAVLLPYDPNEYRNRGSGVLIEAVSSGYPIVASLGTWAATAIHEGHAVGEIFSPFDSSALADAIGRLVGRFDVAQEMAGKRATAFAAYHTPQTYVSVLLAIAARRTNSGSCAA